MISILRVLNPEITKETVSVYKETLDDKEKINELSEKAKTSEDIKNYLFDVIYYGSSEDLFKNILLEEDSLANDLLHKDDLYSRLECDAMFLYASIVFAVKDKKEIKETLKMELSEAAGQMYIGYKRNLNKALTLDNPKRYLLRAMINEKIFLIRKNGTLLSVLDKAGGANRKKFSQVLNLANDSSDQAYYDLQKLFTGNYNKDFSTIQVFNQVKPTISFNEEIKDNSNNGKTISELIEDNRPSELERIDNEVQKQQYLELLPCPIMRLVFQNVYLESEDRTVFVKKREIKKAKKLLNEKYGIGEELFDKSLRYSEYIIKFKLNPEDLKF